MTQSVKDVPCKHVSLSLDPQDTHKTGYSSAHPGSQHIYCYAWEAETGQSPKTGWSVELAYTVANTDILSQKMEWKARTITPDT